MSKKLFKRIASIDLIPVSGLAKTFNYPPFRIDFETDLDRFASTKIRLYNPNKATIEACDPVKVGTSFQYADLVLTAGYEDLNGVVCGGKIFQIKVTYAGTDKILELSVSEKAGIWSETNILKSYKKTPASVILADICETSNIQIGKISLGEDKLLSYGATSLRKAIDDICNNTNSEFYFDEGKIFIVGKSIPSLPSQIYLDHTSGLIGRPEKLEKKRWKVRSLFRHEFRFNQVIKVRGGELDSQIKIIKGKGKFSTHSNEAYSEIEGIEI